MNYIDFYYITKLVLECLMTTCLCIQ